jgi:hypothetical protein
MEYTFTRYLAAKKSVDDRALNRHVWHSLAQAVPAASPERPLQVLEIGAGIGTMVERLVDWGLLTYASLSAVDAERDNIAEARRRLPRWATERGFAVGADGGMDRESPVLVFERDGQHIAVELVACDLFDFVEQEQGRRAWDLLVAHAFLDLMDIPTTLPLLMSLVRPGGLLYLTINFDGGTLLQPEIDRAFDDHIEALYHQTMDERITKGKPSGDSRSGRHLFGHLRAAGAQVLDAGSSDWVVFAGAGGYPADEAYFLHFFIETMRGALQGHAQLDAGRFAAWIDERHAQMDRGDLVYIAHQLDFLARRG